MFAMALPGLGGLLAEEVAAAGGVVSDVGFDGRSDVVTFEAERSDCRRLLGLRLSEDVFVEVGRTLRADGDRPDWIAGRIWRPERVRRALEVRAAVSAPAARRSTFRVIVRVTQERSFLRTDLRREFVRAIARERPDWRADDPAQVEVWSVEYRPGRLVAGLRLSDARMRQHDGRAQERRGALRPTLAAAMVLLAGEPDGVLLDPCCGSGTLLAEADAVGWSARGVDIDPSAVAVARRNAPRAGVDAGDARGLALADASVAAVVSNLPFGRQYGVDGPMDTWLGEVLAEVARVTRPGGRVVLLAPALPRRSPPALRPTDRVPLRLLGTRTTLWGLDRV
jgi:23S rRNA G2445 N2-methylase RlmL